MTLPVASCASGSVFQSQLILTHQSQVIRDVATSF